MDAITVEVDHHIIDKRLICVTTIYKDGAFLYSSTTDVTDQIDIVLSDYIKDKLADKLAKH